MTVVVLDDYQGCAEGFADWTTVGRRVNFIHEHLQPVQLRARLRDAEIVVAMRERTVFDRELLCDLPALRLLVTTGTGNASIDLVAAAECGVTVCGTRSLAAPTVEMTWALILATARQIPQEISALGLGYWQTTVGADLSGRTLGLLGLGRIGAEVARIGMAFGMSVISWSQNLNAEYARSMGVEPVSKVDLFRRSDVLSIHVRLSERTKGLVGLDEMASMPPGSILVNTARGPIVNELDLLSVLDSGPVDRVGLDVFDDEPLPLGHSLRCHPKVIATPHLGYVTDASFTVFFGDVVENIRAWQNGFPIRVLTEPKP